MHSKTIHFNTHNDLGQCFAEAIDISRRSGGGFEKIAGELHPVLQRFMSDLRPDPRYQYVLMTPMGAYEYWGMNVNGDVFPEVSLGFDPDCDDPVQVAKELEARFLAPFGKSLPTMPDRLFGHKTFMDALRYRHHVNKNPEIAYGDIVCVVFNKAMKRVELISRHDREKAKRVGADDIIRDLDEGKPRQISMGCKVPFDVCTICGHISRTSMDYCSHLKTGMGTVREDGKIIGAVNFFPRFFDLSDVFIPAAKESGVIMKVASARGINAHSSKTAGIKTSTITKRFLPNAVSEELIRRMSQREMPLPTSLMNRFKIGPLLSTMALNGIVARPREFQYGMLRAMGKPQMASRLHAARQVFAPSSAPVTKRIVIISSGDFSPRIARALSSIIPHRSGFHPHLPDRILRMRMAPPPIIEKVSHVHGDDLLDKIASLYSQYRDSVKSLPNELSVAVEQHPQIYRENFFGNTLSNSMSKLAQKQQDGVISSSLYMWNVYRDDVRALPVPWETSSYSLSSSLIGPA
jgi:hypothetical protein